MAIIASLDGEEEAKYTKKSSTYRTRAQSLLCIILLPTAATVTTDVWFQSAILSSAFGYDLVLAFTNVSGAFFDGFLSAWETGRAVPSGARTEALHLLSDDMRALFLSTYTSWAGLVSVAASLAHAKSSVSVGIVYMLLSIICAFVAHGLGSDTAQYISSAEPITKKPYTMRAHKLVQQFMMSLAIYISVSYIYLGEENIEDSDDEGGDKFWVTATPRNQLVVSSVFAVLGAYGGHLLADIISQKLIHPLIPMETLACNLIFGILGLSLNLMKIRDELWGDSLILRGFAINFCGAASLFARHASDSQRLNAIKRSGRRRAAINMAANFLSAYFVFWLAFETEEWLQPSETRRGVMHKIMKILRKARAGKEQQ